MNINFDQHLQQQINDYCSECEPVPDKEGNVINCTECTDLTCEYYYQYNEFESPLPEP